MSLTHGAVELKPERTAPAADTHDRDPAPDWQGPRELERRLTELESKVNSPKGTPVERLAGIDERLATNRWMVTVFFAPMLISAASLVAALIALIK